MAEISQQQVYDLLCEVADGIDRLDAKLDETLVLMRTMNYEFELGRQRIVQAKASYRQSREIAST